MLTVDLFSVYLLSRVNIVTRYIEVDFTFGLPDYVRYIEEFVISRFYSKSVNSTYPSNSFEEEAFCRNRSASFRLQKIYKHFTPCLRIMSTQGSLCEPPANDIIEALIFTVSKMALRGKAIVFTRECNETSIAGGEKALTHSLDFVNYFINGNYNVPYYNAADQCIRLSPW